MTLLGLWLGCTAPPDSDADTEVEAVAVTCPPPEPTGLEVGMHAQDVAFTDCDGAAVSLHGLCGRPALVANWYGWCPTCETNAALARRLAGEHPDLQVVVALDEDPLTHPVDAAFCASYAAAYPSAAALWLDPAGGLEVYGDTDLVLVLDREGTLRFERQTATEAAIVAAVEEAL